MPIVFDFQNLNPRPKKLSSNMNSFEDILRCLDNPLTKALD